MTTIQQMPDAELIAFGFFDELFRRYAPDLQAYLFEHYGPAERALDAFAETWRRIHAQPAIVARPGANSVRPSIFTLAATIALRKNPARLSRAGL